MPAMCFKDVGILSIGEMGLGIAQLLIAHGITVFTYAKDRSEHTQSRAIDAGVCLSPTLEDLVSSTSVILSIVPPRDAHETAIRVLAATPTQRVEPLYYLDLNAISPAAAIETSKLLAQHSGIIFLDGGIIGGLAHPLGPEEKPDKKIRWHCPNLIVSGPHKLPDQDLASLLHVHHLDAPIGAATGLKMCFASMTKGAYALAIEGFTTAHELGILPELRIYLERYFPAVLKFSEKGLVTMPHKAYRWVHEMQEIGETMAGAGFDKGLFMAVAEVYRTVAEETLLGQEKPLQRVRGQTVEDVVALMGEGLRARKLKSE